jgi:hypothetical protein
MVTKLRINMKKLFGIILSLLVVAPAIAQNVGVYVASYLKTTGVPAQTCSATSYNGTIAVSQALIMYQCSNNNVGGTYVWNVLSANASNITTGTLPHAQLPALVIGDIPTLVSLYDPLGTAATDLTAAEAYSANANNISSGTLGHARLPTFVSGDIPNNAANTSGTAANITAASNSSLTTLPSLSLPASQVTGLGGVSADAGFNHGFVERCLIGVVGTFASPTPAFVCQGDYLTSANGTPALASATTTTPLLLEASSAATTGSSAGWYGYSAPYLDSKQPTLTWIMAYAAAGDYATVRQWMGLLGNSCSVNTLIAGDNPTCSYVLIRYSTVAGDTYYECVSANGSAQTVTPIGTVAPSTTPAVMNVTINASTATCTVAYVAKITRVTVAYQNFGNFSCNPLAADTGDTVFLAMP